MKKTTLSLIAVMAMASSLAAAEVEKNESMISGISNVTVSGDAKLYYHTQDDTTTGSELDMFSQDSSNGQVGFNVGVSADLTENVSGKVSLMGVSTLGLENNLVGNVWSGGTPQTEIWANEAWVAGTLGKTTAKVGRMELDTPLAFTEKWSVAENTFEAGVLMDQTIPDTTLVGAYVGRSNGGVNGSLSKIDEKKNDTFDSFYSDYTNPNKSINKGAYVLGAVNNSWKPLNVQAWYYNITSVVDAYWVQGDLDIKGIQVGAQYTAGNEKVTDTDMSAYAVRVGYANKDLMDLKVEAAYSQTGEDAGFGYNLATGGQSKLYTEMYFNFNQVTSADTASMKFGASITVPGDVGLMAQYVQADTNNADTASEITVEAKKSFGGLSTSLAYMSVKDLGVSTFDNSQSAENMVQAKIGYSF